MGTNSPQTFIAYIEIRLSAHATENPNKVIKASNHIFPTRYLNKITFKSVNLQGHHGNPIIMFQTKVKDKEIVEALMQNLALNLSSMDKETLSKEIHRHVNKGSLYIRLDKQAAFHGEFRLHNVDPIHLHIRFKKNKLEDIVTILRKIGIIN